jgi:SagB-type dehydrogenase family enzyme
VGGVWLGSGVVVELPCGGNPSIVVPATRTRLAIDAAEAALLCEIARCNADGAPCTFDGVGASVGVERFVSDFTAMHVLAGESEVDRPSDHASRQMLTLLECATLRMSQVGARRRTPLQPCEVGNSLTGSAGRARIRLPEPAPPRADLWEVAARRRSRRGGPRREIPLSALSALLGFSLRVQGSMGQQIGDAMLRPVASGGARHPLDVFVAATRVSDLAMGVFRYDPHAHALVDADVPPHSVGILSDLALNAVSDRGGFVPALTLFFAAVPTRTGCQYQNIALSLIMRDLGCATQQLYLLAEGLGLAGCAIGTADPAVTEDALRLRDDEVFVGGFSIW